jgi:hypothetical protein
MKGQQECSTCGLTAEMMGDRSASTVAESFRMRALYEESNANESEEEHADGSVERNLRSRGHTQQRMTS